MFPAVRLSVFAGLTVILAVTAAAADTRIFSARASAPGVTIEQALRNDTPLPLVGRGDGATLFRIDDPATVSCANHLVFVTSTGEHVDLAADLCALNWDVTVQVKSGSPGAAQTTAPTLAKPPTAAVTPPPPPAAATLLLRPRPRPQRPSPPPSPLRPSRRMMPRVARRTMAIRISRKPS